MSALSDTFKKASEAAGQALNGVCQHLHLSEDETKEVFELFTEEFGRMMGEPKKKRSKKK